MSLDCRLSSYCLCLSYRGNPRCERCIFNLDPLMWLFDSKHVEYCSPLPPQECAERLREVVAQERVLGFSMAAAFGSKPLIGKVSDTSLQIRKRISGRNSFQPIFSASMQPNGKGTKISGNFGLHPFSRVFMIGFLGITGLMTLIAVPGFIADRDWVGLMPVGMFGFGIVLVWVGRMMSRHEVFFVEQTLVQSLEFQVRGIDGASK